jgi:hypothetical protein
MWLLLGFASPDDPSSRLFNLIMSLSFVYLHPKAAAAAMQYAFLVYAVLV